MLPVKLEIENFMSYDKATLEFNFTSALIAGANGAGKSACFSAIEWALWGETRHKIADSVVRRGQAMCKVEFLFSHDNKLYKIVRTRNVKQSKMEVEFEEIYPDGRINDMTHDTNRLTEAEIRKVLKSNHEVFINSSYFRQNSFFDFVQGTFATRQAIISSLLNLDKWNKYQKHAKESFGVISEKIESLKTDLSKVDDLNGRLTKVKTNITLTQQTIADLNAEETSLQEKAKILEVKINEDKEVASKYNMYKDLQDRVATQRKSIQSSELIINERNSVREKLEQNIEANKLAISNLVEDIEALSAKVASQNFPDASKMESALIEGRTQHKVLIQQIDNLVNNDSCLMCGHEWKDQQAKKAFIDERVAKKIAVEEKLKRAEAKLAAIKSEIEQAKKVELELQKQRLQKSSIENNIELGILKKNAVDAEIARTQDQLKTMLNQLGELEAILSTVEAVDESVDIKEVQISLGKVKSRQVEVRSQLSKHTYNLGALTQEEKGLNEKIAESKKIEDKLAHLNRQAAIYGQLSKIFSKDGIQAIIIDNIIEELTNTTNYWLSQFSHEPISVNFITQKRNTKGDWRETFDIEIQTPTGPCQFEDFSGGEGFRIGFAIRLALSAIQAKRMGGEVQLLMLDEVSSSLDPAGLEIFVSIVRRLEKDMKVMVITHDEKLKEEFSTIITVEKTPSGSRILP